MRPPVAAIALLSAAALAYQILLIRLFSIIQWHHFAYMVISLSLLGYGVSGMFLSLARDWLRNHYPAAFIINGLLFSVSGILCFLVGQRIPFNPLEIVWTAHQLLYLLMLYLLLAVPFFAVANCIGLTLFRFPDCIPRIYGFDLLGAGGGALGIIALLSVIPPMDALYVISALGLLSTAIGFLEVRFRPRWIAALTAAGILLLIPLHQLEIPLRISPYKSLSQTLAVIGTEVVEERSSPLGYIAVVQSPVIPFRHAPGISLNTSLQPPDQLGVFTDGGNMGVITADQGRRKAFAYTDYLTSALAYHMLDSPRVLVLGAGGGADVLQAQYFGAAGIDAVELNPQIVDLVTDANGDFAGHLYSRENIDVHIAEARGFVANSKERYDLIQVALLDAFSASSAGLYALSESYIYTVEALVDYIGHLRPNGLLSVTRWVKIPPRDGLKLFYTAVKALEKTGVDDPGRRLMLIRSWQTSTLLIKNGDFTAGEIQTVQEFCATRFFNLGYYPGMSRAEANKYDILPQPYFFEGATALLDRQKRGDFVERYKFDIEPATDDRPYFSNFFKWSALGELLSLRARGGLPLLEQGYLILIATLLQAVLASVLLILVPLWFGYRKAARTSPGSFRREQFWVIVYFFSLGLAFLFIEMAFIQKFILFLWHPLYAVGVVVAGFLVFAGFGSSYCARYTGDPSLRKKYLVQSVAAIAGISLFYLFLLPVLFTNLVWLPGPLKVAVTLCLIAPLAFCMGMPFPLGLSTLSGRASALIPWAWGINGCASVISAVLAIVLATHIGFRGVVIIAMLLYGIAAYALPDREADGA